MKPDSPTDPRKALEPSLTALLLGELPPDQAEFLRRAMEQDPELAHLHDRLKQTIGFIQEAASAPASPMEAAVEPLKLADSRRQALLQQFKTLRHPAFQQRPRKRVHWPLAAAAAVVVGLMGVSMLLPALGKAKAKAQRVTLRTPAENQGVTEHHYDLAPSGNAGTLTLGRVEIVADASAPPDSTAVARDELQGRALRTSADRKTETEVSLGFKGLSAGQAVVVLPERQASEGVGGFRAGAWQSPAGSDGRNTESILTNREISPEVIIPRPPLLAANGSGAGLGGGIGVARLEESAKAKKAEAASPPAQEAFRRRYAGRAASPAPASGLEERESFGENEAGAPVRRLRAGELAQAQETAKPDEAPVSRERFGLPATSSNQPKAASAPTTPILADDLRASAAAAAAPRRSAADKDSGVEQLNRDLAGRETKELDELPAKAVSPALTPQPEVTTSQNPFSTFSLNVSDVSFKLAAASLEQGLLPSPGSIRSEEFINAFDYRDPEPPAGAPVGFTWERARYPFAQNRDLLRLSLKTAARGRAAGRPLNVVLALDTSGSMERADRVRIVREALRVLATELRAQDLLSVVTFARTPRLRVDGVPGNQAGQVAEQISGLTPEGGTDLEQALNLAYQTALRHYLPSGLNRVVLLTDGAANLGTVEPTALKQKIEAHRRQGIALDAFGIGWEGYHDDLLEQLTRNGDGRYGFLNTPEEAGVNFAGQLAGALRVSAADVKVQVEFNPNRVAAYRQVGYAKHQLTREQFRDNTVDAAELGAAEAGNALYVVEVNSRGAGPLATIRVRYKVPGTADYREQEWPVPYQGNAVALEQASPTLRLAAVASAFSEWLASSPFAAEVTPDRLLTHLRGVPEVYGADTRPKRLEWMIREAKSLTGK
jgi:Mg-chelatase subunit ChlD